LCRDW